VGRFLRGRPSSAPTPTHLLARPGLPAHYHVAVTDKRGQPVNSLFPQIFPHLLARVATPDKLPATGRSPITTPYHKDGRVFTYHLEPSGQLRCTVTSHHCCLLLCCSLSLLQPRCPRQELNDEASRRLPLAELTQLRVHRLVPGVALSVHAHSCVARVHWCPSLLFMDTWMPPVQLTSSPPTYGQNPFSVASMPTLPLLPSLHSAPHERIPALPARRAITSLSPSLRRPVLLLCNTRL
jgi:hypothetical protein